MKYLNENEAIDIFETFKDMIDSDIPIDEELEIYEDAIKAINPFQMKQYFDKKENKKYYLPLFKSIVKKWEGEQKPSGESKPKKKLKKVKLNIVIDDEPLPSQEDSNAKLKQRQQAMKDKLKKINESWLEKEPTVPSQPKKITSPNGFGAFETYLLLRIQPDKDNEANNLIKMLENDFIERGFNATATKDIKKILKTAKYKELFINSKIQERINNPVAPSVAPSESLPSQPSEQPKKRGRPPKKKIPEGSNKLVLVDNIIKKNNEVTKMLKDYYNFVYEEGSQ